MTPVRLALIATAAAGLTAIVAPASASQIIMGPDGHYYRLVPVRGPAPGEASYTPASHSERRPCLELPADQFRGQ